MVGLYTFHFDCDGTPKVRHRHVAFAKGAASRRQKEKSHSLTGDLLLIWKHQREYGSHPLRAEARDGRGCSAKRDVLAASAISPEADSNSSTASCRSAKILAVADPNFDCASTVSAAFRSNNASDMNSRERLPHRGFSDSAKSMRVKSALTKNRKRGIYASAWFR